jgi:hypothetical protein
MTIEEIIEEYGLKSKCRKRELVYTRNILYKHLRNKGMSLQAIGKKFNRDHATVLFGLNQYERLCGYEDFETLKENVCNKLELNQKLKPKAQVSYLEQKVLDCNNLKQLLELKDEIRKTLEEREEENIFTTFEI